MGPTHINSERQQAQVFNMLGLFVIKDYSSGNKYLTEEVGKIRAKYCAAAHMGLMGSYAKLGER